MSFKHTVVMPKMSMTMETGELIGFHVAEGQEVKAGDVLFEVMTDKIDMEVEAPADGKIESIIATPGAVLEIGKPVLIMETQSQVLSFDFMSDDSAEVVPVTPVIEAAPAIVPTIAPAPPTIISEVPKAVPAARNLAAEKGINLQTVAPTGPFETITYEDVTNANVDPAIAQRQNANKALIAKGIEMTLAIPQTSFTRAITSKSKIEGATESWHALLLSTWAKTLRNFQNSENSENSEIGVALIIESKYGSALPVFKNPDRMDLTALTSLVKTTTEQAKNGKVPLAMLNGATTTIFDLTSYSMQSTKPVLFPHQNTGLTVGVDSSAANAALTLSLTIDLRALDFYDGATLLDRLIRAI